MREWMQLARQPKVVKRALKYAVVVGSVLVAINHGEALLRGDVPLSRLLRILLTVTVPYVVSTASAVSAIRDREREEHRR
jgi:hypothetical protein